MRTLEIPVITMMSSAENVAGQGVGSAYREQLNLVNERLNGIFDIRVNEQKYGEITHYHTIDFRYYLHALFGRKKTYRVGYVHFIPETLDGSLKLAKPVKIVFYRYLLKFYQEMDQLVVVNPMFIDKLVALGFDRNKITYIPNYVSDVTFHRQSAEDIAATKAKYGLDPDRFTVLGVGQVQTRKGVLDFIEVAKMLPHIQFVWAGGFSFGKITAGYEELKEAMENCPSNVKFLGIIQRDDMNAVYNAADVMFLPSYAELFPMTILESMAIGVPILLRDLDLYENILFDYYMKGTSNEMFRDELIRLSEDADYYEAYRQKSLEGKKFYSKQSVGTMWERFYSSLLEKEVYEQKTVY